MNDKNLINCLAQKQLKDFDFQIKLNSSFKNKLKPLNNNPFETNYSIRQNAFNKSFNYDKNANLIQNTFNCTSNSLNSFGNSSTNSSFNSFNNSNLTNLTFQNKFGASNNFKNQTSLNGNQFDNNLNLFQNTTHQTTTCLNSNSNFNPFLNANQLNNLSNSSLSSFDNNLSTNNLLSTTNILTGHLTCQNNHLTKVTNCDLINLDKTNQLEDKYSIFKEIANGDEHSSLNLFNDNSFNSKIDLNEDFGEFKSFGESFGEFKSYNNQNSASSKFEEMKLNEIDEHKLIRFQQLLNGILSVLHKSFNIMMVNYDEASVQKALFTSKGKEFCLDLKEVFYISKRISSSLIGLQSCDNLLNLIDKINNLWSLLDKIIQKVLPFDDLFLQVCEIENQSRLCTLCCSNLKIGHSKFYNLNGFDYHLACLNFYKNCCSDSILPSK